MNDQLIDIENLNERKESTDGFDEVSSKKNRKRINPNNVLPSRASERISRVALNKIIEAEDREAFAKVKRICKIKDKSSKKSSSSNISHSKCRSKKSDNISKRSNKKDGRNSIKKKRIGKNNTSRIDIAVKDECSNDEKSPKTTNNSNIILSSSKTFVSPPSLPPKLSSSRLIAQPSSNNISTPPKPVIKSSTLVNNFASQNLPIKSNSPRVDYVQNGNRMFCAKLSKNVSTVIKPPRKCYNTLPISKPPVRQPIFRNTPISLNSNNSQSTHTNTKPTEVKRVVYICVKNSPQNTSNQVLPKVCSYISSSQKPNVPSLPPSRNSISNFTISRPEPRPFSSLRITNNTSVTQRIPISSNTRVFTIQKNNEDKTVKNTIS